jgi:hypothetical protein
VGAGWKPLHARQQLLCMHDCVLAGLDTVLYPGSLQWSNRVSDCQLSTTRSVSHSLHYSAYGPPDVLTAGHTNAIVSSYLMLRSYGRYV